MNAISISDLCFSYGSNQVLNKFSAQIKCGQIYALLGPSGGGKTTLLRLILGRIKIESGYISVIGQKPGLINKSISFMPQENALCPQFTIEQTLNYFKYIYRIPNEEFKIRWKYLKKLLHIPDRSGYVSQLSGGQQRRVSLAVAFINNPSLVILDEPTVGIDALLRNEIWQYLITKSKEGLTVVIVTHYIEEANCADRVGLMRNGLLLAEDNPNVLMRKYNENSLEDVFLKLCLLDNKNTKDLDNKCNQNLKNTCNETNQAFIDDVFEKEFISQTETNSTKLILNFWLLLILIHRNTLKFFRMGLSIIVIFLPAIQALVFCLAYSKELIKVLEITFKKNIFHSKSFLKVKAAVFNGEFQPDYSQRLFSSIVTVKRHAINPVYYSSLDKAINAVKNREAIGAVWIPNGYSDALDDRIKYGILSDNQTIIDSTLRVYIDNSILMYGIGFMNSLTATFQHFLNHLYVQKNLTAFQIPLTIEETKNSQNLLFKDYYMPGYYLFFNFMSQLTLSSLILTQERKDGLFERSLVAGVSHELIFVSHFITSCLISIIQVILMYLTAFVLFDSPNHGLVWLVILYFTSDAIKCISIGFLISSLIDRELLCLIIVWSISIPQILSTGIFWPLESIAIPFRYLFYLCPLTQSVETMRSIMLRGWDYTNPHIQFAFFINILITILVSLIALIIFKRR